MDHSRLLLAFALAVSSFNGCKAQACANQPYLPRIVGGTEATPRSWPWIVTLSYNISDPYCGGSLISELWVLTAAHCMDPPGYENLTTIHLGRHFVSNLSETVSRGIESMWCHVGYNLSWTGAHDLCLLKMSAPVEFTEHIQPVCLAAEGSVFPSGLHSWVAGWGTLDESGEGFPDTLQKVKLPIVGINECRCLNTLYIPETTICAGYSEGGKDSCQGDSGGPLVVRQSTVWVQAGIVSFGEGCGRKDRPGAYALVSAYQDWISEVIGDSYPPGFVLFEPKEENSDEHYVCQNKSEFYDLYYSSVMDHCVGLHSCLLFSLYAVVLVVTLAGMGDI